MSGYKIITEKEDIILKKKDNKFKLETNKKIKIPCNIIELVDKYEIFNLFKLLNEKIITKCKLIKNDLDNQTNSTDIILYLNNFMKNEEDSDDNELDENFYLSFTSSIIKKTSKSIVLHGKKNHLNLEKEGYKKIQIDNILLSVDLENDNIEIKLNFEYIGEKLPMYAENTLGLVFRKMIKNLILYYSK